MRLTKLSSLTMYGVSQDQKVSHGNLDLDPKHSRGHRDNYPMKFDRSV